MKFRKKPVVIEALQFTDHHAGESILAWINGGTEKGKEKAWFDPYRFNDPTIHIKTLETP